MLPDRCSVKEKGEPCVNPPEFVISVIEKNDEYMIGVTCQKHQEAVSKRVSELQKNGKVPKGKIKFSTIKAVGSDCIRAEPDDLIQL